MPEWIFFLGQVLITVSREQLAVVVVTLSAAAFAVYSVVVLGKIARCSEEGYARLLDMLAGLRETEEALKVSCRRMASAAEGGESAQRTSEAGLKQVIGKTQDPVSGLSSFSRVELTRLLAQNSTLEAALNEAKSKLMANDGVIAGLRQQKAAADEAEAAMARLHAQNRRLLITLRDTRRRLREAELKAESGEIAASSPEQRPVVVVKEPSDESVAENAALRGRIRALETESSRMRAAIDAREEELARTLREKTLIEERFMQREMSDETPEKISEK